MERYTFTAGIGQDANGEGIDGGQLAQALATIRADLASTFGGYTETASYGGWINGKGELITEPGRRFVVLTERGVADPVEVAHRICAALRQECVVLETETVAGAFVEARAVSEDPTVSLH